MVEILAPVGSWEMLEAAVRSGADAVYFGAQNFSARRNAENFDDDTLRAAIEYCHIRGVKAYLTLNIMLKQGELEAAASLVQRVYAFGIDAIIVSDLGMAALIHKAYPSLELHASTQMSVHSPAALTFLKALGISRVVAAREMSEKELQSFCAEARRLQMEVEYFVHGALCMSVSGQCLFSSVLGARSGNRGLCAGPCRLPFSVHGGTGYDLSLKDLSLIDEVKTLEKMGVYSLKIEGRMKRPEYVAAASAAFRMAADTAAVPIELRNSLLSVFSRSGFTKGYFEGRLGRDMFGIRTRDDVEASKDAIAKIHELYRNERQAVSIDIKIVAKAGEALSVAFFDGVNEALVKGDIPEIASNRAVDENFIRDSLSKLGGTPYFARKIDIELDDNLFLRSSQLNAARREATEKLSLMRARASTKRAVGIKIENGFELRQTALKMIARFAKESQIPKNLDNIAAIILPSNLDFPDFLPTDIIKITQAPRYILNEPKLKARFKELKQQGVEAVYCDNLSAVQIAKEAGLKVLGGIGLNICNSQSIAVLTHSGISAVTLSAECLLSDAVRLKSDIPKGIFAYGRLPLMLLRNCPLKNGRNCNECDKQGFITDRLGKQFPIRCSEGYSELYNCAPLYLGDRVKETVGLDFLLLYFTTEQANEAERIVLEYQNEAVPTREYTRGLYYKNLI